MLNLTGLFLSIFMMMVGTFIAHDMILVLFGGLILFISTGWNLE